MKGSLVSEREILSSRRAAIGSAFSTSAISGLAEMIDRTVRANSDKMSLTPSLIDAVLYF